MTITADSLAHSIGSQQNNQHWQGPQPSLLLKAQDRHSSYGLPTDQNLCLDNRKTPTILPHAEDIHVLSADTYKLLQLFSFIY